MRKYLLPENGNFYKVNLHCHTDISDGKETPKEVKEHYKALGYHAVCYTDHEVLIGHKELCDDEFIALHGYEVAIKKDLDKHTSYFMPVYHFNFIAEDQDNLNIPRFFAKNPSLAGNARLWLDKCVYDENDTIDTTEYDIDWLNDYLAAVRDAGFLVTYNHPCWSLQNSYDYMGLKGLHGVEVMNGGCIYQGDRSSVHYNEILHDTPTAVPVGGDDNHRASDVGKAWTVIKAPELTYDALISAYKKGDCYASYGPEIKELYIEDGKLYIKTSPAAVIFIRGEGRFISSVHDLDHATFLLEPQKLGRYFRIEVMGNDGSCAVTKAYMTSDYVQ